MTQYVAVATDQNFAMPTAVTLRSLLLHASGPLHVTVLHDQLPDDVQQRILRSLPDADATVRWVNSCGFDAHASRASHLPPATYFRLWVARTAPDSAKRVLYLDVDVLVRRDLAPLFDWDLDGRAVGAVRSIHYPCVGTRGAVNDWKVLGLDPATPFFNAGVLLIDLARWRGLEVEAKSLEYLRSQHLGGGADQEAINVALQGDWMELPPTYNQQTPILTDDHGAHLLYDDDTVDEARRSPSIVHFQTRPKPWHRGSEHPWKGEWTAVARDVDFRPIGGLRERSIVEESRWRIKRSASVILKGR